jgi:superfamily I DNA/RNA helicase
VATTRAKDELYITHPVVDASLRGRAALLVQPSRFLREIRFTLYEQGEVRYAAFSNNGDGS